MDYPFKALHLTPKTLKSERKKNLSYKGGPILQFCSDFSLYRGPIQKNHYRVTLYTQYNENKGVDNFGCALPLTIKNI